MPRLIAKSASPPRSTSPLCPITASVATSAGATQVVTISAESAPITATPPKVPARCLLLASASRVWIAAGIWIVKRPNIESASTMKSSANTVTIHGCWNTACTCAPAAAAAMPASVYVNAMPST